MRTIRFETGNLFDKFTPQIYLFRDDLFDAIGGTARVLFSRKEIFLVTFFFLFSYSRSLQQALAIFFQYFVQLGTLGLKWQDFLSFSPSTFKWCKGKIFEMADLRKNYERNFLIFYNFQEKKNHPLHDVKSLKNSLQTELLRTLKRDQMDRRTILSRQINTNDARSYLKTELTSLLSTLGLVSTLLVSFSLK